MPLYKDRVAKVQLHTVLIATLEKGCDSIRKSAEGIHWDVAGKEEGGGEVTYKVWIVWIHCQWNGGLEVTLLKFTNL